MDNLYGPLCLMWFILGGVGYFLQLWARGEWLSESPRDPGFQPAMASVVTGPFALIVGIVRVRQAVEEATGWKENRAYWAQKDQYQREKVEDHKQQLQQLVQSESREGKLLLSRVVQGSSEFIDDLSSSSRPLQGLDPEYSSLLQAHISLPKSDLKLSDQGSDYEPLVIEVRVISKGSGTCVLEPCGKYQAVFFSRDGEHQQATFQIVRGNPEVGRVYRITFNPRGLRHEFLQDEELWIKLSYAKADFEAFITDYNEDRYPIFTLIYSLKPV